MYICRRCFPYLTVNVIITHPAGRDARRVSTLELTGTTRGWSTFHLIRAITTIILTITHKVFRDAAAAGTCELIWSTGDVA